MVDLDDSSRADALEASLADWDACVHAYDESRFPLAQWVLETARRLEPRVRSLETIHEDVPLDRIYPLSKELCAATCDEGFTELVRRFVLDVVAPAGGLEEPLAVQRFLNVRIMLPDRPQGVFPFHTGLLYGHGAASRSLWLPLTDVRGEAGAPASLHIVGLEESRRLTDDARRAGLGIPEMAELFLRSSHPVSAGPGDVLFFTQEHIHGNVVNTTGRTRVSIDFRVAEQRFGDLLARKCAGGYFELIEADRGPRPERAEQQRLIYLNNATPATVGIPVHLQRLMVLDYCARHDLAYHFEYFELEGMQHMPTLAHAVESLDCDVLLYSVYSLPTAPDERARVLERALERGLALHFANEGLVVVDAEDRRRLERLLSFARYGD